MREFRSRYLVAAAASAALAAAVVAVAAPAAHAATCVTSDQMGHCGGYAPEIPGYPDSYVDQNVWSPINGWHQTLYANSPSDWHVTANMPAGNTSVVSFPNTGQAMNEARLSTFSSLTSSFTETMNKTATTSGWSMYDVWVDNWNYEIMIQLDFANNGDCTSVASTTFNGQAWHLCDFGHTLAVKLGAGEGSQKRSEQTGTVDLKAMLTWLESRGNLPAGTTLTNVSFGWEICSTGGQDETFQVTHYDLTASTGSTPSPTTSTPAPTSSAPSSTSSAPSPTGSTTPTPPTSTSSSRSASPTPTTSTPPPPSGTLLVGDSTVEPTVDSNPAGVAQAYQYVAAKSGTTATLRFYVDGSSTATSGKLGIYTNSSYGDPNRLLKQTAFTPARGWNTVTLSGVTLTAGKRYWLAELGTAGTLAYRDQGGISGGAYSETRSAGSSLPSSWSSGFRWDNSGHASFYAAG